MLEDKEEFEEKEFNLNLIDLTNSIIFINNSVYKEELENREILKIEKQINRILGNHFLDMKIVRGDNLLVTIELSKSVEEIENLSKQIGINEECGDYLIYTPAKIRICKNS